jgi:hypothetical protein
MPRTFACIAAEDGIGAEARYPFFFGRMLPTGVSMPLVNKEVAAAGAAGLAVFGLRVSRLPRFCPLAMLLSSVCRVWKLCRAETQSPAIFEDPELYKQCHQRPGFRIQN